ncbi:hypothetical protein Hanom_Chr08g00702951 [Helianthus anomalus]
MLETNTHKQQALNNHRYMFLSNVSGNGSMWICVKPHSFGMVDAKSFSVLFYKQLVCPV